MTPQTITDAIALLYEEADTAPPTMQRRVVPLGTLVKTYNVNCSEVAGLTYAGAMQTLAQRGGLLAQEEPPMMQLAGFLYATPHFGSIFVEQTDPVTRRRFSIAHELGHYLLHFRPVLAAASTADTLPEAVDAFPHTPEETAPDKQPTGHIVIPQHHARQVLLPAFEQMEREANQFAAELLMPSSLMHNLVAHYARQFRGEDLVWRLSTELLVSRTAIDWRIKNLNLLPQQSVNGN